jgi:hypothetical protein
LLEAHPEFIPEAERLAAGILSEATWESVRDDVKHTSAHRLAAGVLAGLNACADEHDRDGPLGYVGDTNTYANAVLNMLDKFRSPLPGVGAECPDWPLPSR